MPEIKWGEFGPQQNTSLPWGISGMKQGIYPDAADVQEYDCGD
jgi:hypothetical protein